MTHSFSDFLFPLERNYLTGDMGKYQSHQQETLHKARRYIFFWMTCWSNPGPGQEKSADVAAILATPPCSWT